MTDHLIVALRSAAPAPSFTNSFQGKVRPGSTTTNMIAPFENKREKHKSNGLTMPENTRSRSPDRTKRQSKMRAPLLRRRRAIPVQPTRRSPDFESSIRPEPLRAPPATKYPTLRSGFRLMVRLQGVASVCGDLSLGTILCLPSLVE